MVSIDLCMIVRNEARCLARCLASVRAHVDRMIVVDTGSTDGTPELARAAGADVFRFDWCDDFSAARNHALAQSQARWRLVLDADEWIDAEGGTCAALRQFDEAVIGLVALTDVGDDAGPVSGRDAAAGGRDTSARASSGTGLPTAAPPLPEPAWLARVLPAGVTYRGRIHEQPDAAGMARIRLPLQLLHDGYAGRRAPLKARRNWPLIERALLAAPQDPYLLFLRAREGRVAGLLQGAALDEALAAAWQALQRFRAQHGTADDVVYDWHEHLAVAWLDGRLRRGEHAPGWAELAAERALWPHSAGLAALEKRYPVPAAEDAWHPC